MLVHSMIYLTYLIDFDYASIVWYSKNNCYYLIYTI